MAAKTILHVGPGHRRSGVKLPVAFQTDEGRTWGRYSYRTVVGPAKAGLFKEEGKESEEGEELGDVIHIVQLWV